MNETPPSGRFAAKSERSKAPAPQGRIGVLLINLGTPDGTSYWPMRRYLKEFLSDRRVIETNRVLWWLILNFIVLVKRPFASGAKYRSIWNEELDESPLRTITRSQAEKVRKALASKKIIVDWAMRYGSPSIASRVEALVAQGCDRLIAFPLYPQYAAASTATANDKVFDALKTLRAQPALRTVPPYPQDPVYIAALANSIRTHLAGLDFEPEAILASFHGVPQSYVDKGDPYQQQCIETDRGLARGARAARRQAQAHLPVALRPRRMDQALYRQDGRGAGARRREADRHRHARASPPTASRRSRRSREENKEIFLEHGGEKFSYIPCLNDSDGGIDVLVHLIERELQGWV